MKIGVETETCHLWFQNKRMDIFDFIDKAVEFGYDGIVINIVRKKNLEEGLGTLGRDDPEHIRAVAEYIKKNHLYVEVDTRGVNFEHLSHIVEIADMLGADIVRTYIMSGQYSYENLVGTYDSDVLESSIAELKKLLPLLEQHHIYLALENHELETMSEITGIVKRLNSPRVGVLLDFGNMMNAWEEPLTAARKAAPYVITTHVKDNIVTRHDDAYVIAGTALGEGNIDIKGMLNILYEKSSLSRLNMEICNPYASPFQRPVGTGGVTGLGKGAFVVEEPHISPDMVKPLDYYVYDGEGLDALLEMQMKSMKDGVQYIRRLWDSVDKEHGRTRAH